MQKITFYPIGNADCCLIETEKQKFLFDYANVRDQEDDKDLRIDLQSAIKGKLEEAGQDYLDVVVFTHADKDHYNKFSELFYLEHAAKYQSKDRIKIKELWVPAATICDTELSDEGKILRTEARHRLKNKKSIRVFSRPEVLKSWFDEEGLKIEDYKDCLVDAGKLVPGYNLYTENVEFFVHSPFAIRQDDGSLVERNNCSIVVQVCIKSGEHITKILMSADTPLDAWKEIIKTTKFHKNEDRLKYDIFKLPHHCSYLILSNEKGKETTVPDKDVDWMFKQGNEGATIVSTSCTIPSVDTDQPPHRQAANYYKDIVKEFKGEFIVTMEHPKISKPEPLEFTIDETGATLKKSSLGLGAYISSRPAQRAG